MNMNTNSKKAAFGLLFCWRYVKRFAENKSNAVAVLTKTGGGDTIHIEIMQRSDIYEKESFSDSFVNGNGGLHDCLR